MQIDSDDNISIPDTFFIVPDYQGLSYVNLLKWIHDNLNPNRYFEIGVATGATLALSKCASLAVDPNFNLKSDVVGKKPLCLSYQMTSDDFFSKFDPNVLLGGPIDLAFLDGMHYFEYLLRDFINTERHCSNNSIILLHDCIPTDSYIARRDNSDQCLSMFSPHDGWWAGDVWKTAAILLKYRPDLVIYGCKTGPTGLIAVANLDPSSTSLKHNYFKIIGEYEFYGPTKSNLGKFVSEMNFLEQSEFLSHEALSKRFWL